MRAESQSSNKEPNQKSQLVREWHDNSILFPRFGHMSVYPNTL